MQQLKERAERIINDRQSGSMGILEQCVQMFKAYLEDNPVPDVSAMIDTGNSIFRAHGNMAVLFHFFNAFFQEIETEKLLDDGRKAGQNLLAFLNAYTAKWKDAETSIARFLKDEVSLQNKSIFLHSNSSMIVKVLSVLAEEGIFPEIYQTVSWPAEEGKLQAAELAKLGFRINMIADTALQKYIGEIDLALFGCDAIDPGHFVNKTGSLMYASLIKSWNKDVFVLSDSRKLIETKKMPENIQRLLLEERSKDPGEIWKHPPEGVSPLNHYFEAVPNQLASAFILESGIYASEKLESHFKGFRISELFKFED